MKRLAKWAVGLMVCASVAAQGAHAADATQKMSLDDCKAVLEKLKTDGNVKQYKLDPGAEAGLLKLDLSTSGIIDLTPLQGMSIEWLHVDGSDHEPSKVVTLAGLEGMPLKELSLQGNVALEDISAIKGAPLKVFKISPTHGGMPKVKDISALKGMDLVEVGIVGPVEDLSPLAGMKLEKVRIGTASKDVNVLKGMPLKSVQLSGAVTNISGLQGMQPASLSFHGANELSDFTPLKGMKLTGLDLFGTKISDLSPLEGMPLTFLQLGGTEVKDIAPLKGMKLTSLALEGPKVTVTDIGPLASMPLKSIDLRLRNLIDISALKGLPLRDLNITESKVTDISALEECKGLVQVRLPVGITDFSALRKLTKLQFINGQPVADFWKKLDVEEGK